MKRLYRIAVASLSLCSTVMVHAEGSTNEFFMPKEVATQATADDVLIFPAKRVITMDSGVVEAAAVAVIGQRIFGVGTVAELQRRAGKRKVYVDQRFKDKFILPGLIDQHLHPVLGALTLATQVIATEDWVLPGRTIKAANTPEEYMSRLRQSERAMKDLNEPLISWGYHKLWHGKLSRIELDAISTTRPIIIWQRSCHEMYFNTAALKLLNIKAADVEGLGTASTMTNYAQGHFWEQGFMNTPVLPKALKLIATPERLTFGLKQMVVYLQSRGVTAYNEPGAINTPDMWALYEMILADKDTPMYSTFLADGRSIVDAVGMDRALDEVEKTIAIAPETLGKNMMFFSKQIKLFADGAIISQLMQMKEPYTDGHKGEWMINPDDLELRAKMFWDAGYQLHIHVNGDLGAEVVLATLKRRMQENPRQDHRFVVVHFANSTDEQIAQLAKNGAIFSVNPYYPVGFADKYAAGLGKARADLMVRNASILKQTPHLSFHSDMPMAPGDPLFLAWSGVNRITPSGRVAGPEQRISVDAALRAVTIEAAYSWRKEGIIGSIKDGKIANMTILQADPYEVDPRILKDIPVWGTVFEGRVFPVPEAYRSKLVTKAPLDLPKSEFTQVQVANQRVHQAGYEPDQGDNCHLGELSYAVVQAYSANLIANGQLE